MMASDYFALKNTLSAGSLTKGNAEQTLKRKIIGGIGDSIGEAIEESYGGVLQNELEYSAKEAYNQGDKSTFSSRTSEYLSSSEGIQEIISGLAGGPIQAAAVKGGTKILDKVMPTRNNYPKFDLKKVDKPTEVEKPGEAPFNPEDWKTAEKNGKKYIPANAGITEAESMRFWKKPDPSGRMSLLCL